MRKSRRELEITINSILENNNKNKDMLESFILNLKNKFYRGRVVRIFDKSLQITLLSNEELYLVTQALHNITGDKNINPDKWFLESEAKDASKIMLMNGEEDIEPVVEFVDFIKKKGQDEWIGYVPYKRIQDWYEKGLLTYNQDTQRKATIVERGGSKYVLPTIFKSSVTNIAKKMVEGKFYTNQVTLNVTKNFREELFYNESEKILRVPINENTELAIADGAHRILGIVKALNIQPDLDNEIAVSVRNLTVDEAQEFIYQEALMNKQDLTTLRKSSVRDSYMEMAKAVARMGDKRSNILFNRIGFLDGKMNECLVTGEKFSMGLKDNFKDLYEKGDGKELINIVKYVVEFFTYIAELCPYEYDGDYEMLKKRSISTCSNFYVGMLAYARKLYGESDWKDKLEAVIEEMSWDIRDKSWKECGVTVDNMNVKTKKKLYDYFSFLGEDGEDYEKRI